MDSAIKIAAVLKIAAALAIGGYVLSHHVKAEEQLVSFSAGGLIKAQEMNHNFSLLQDRILAGTVDTHFYELDIDCDSDPKALHNYFQSPGLQRYVWLNVTGVCEGNDDGILEPTRDNLWVNGGSIDAQVLVRGIQNAAFGGVEFVAAVEPLIWVDSLGAIYMPDNVYPAGARMQVSAQSSLVLEGEVGDLDLLIDQSSRAFIGRPQGNMARIDANAGNVFADWSSTLNVSEFILRNGANADLGTLVSDNLHVDGSASLVGGTINVSQHLSVTTAASVQAQQVNTDELYMFGASTISSESIATNSLELSSASSVHSANLEINGHLFMRQASIYATNSFSVGSADVGSFSYLELAYPLASMCSGFNWQAVEAWSYSDLQGFPFDCP
ncbi:hypothetical protein [Aliagarivorans taiwanensis]|uniref:hypothetical protein n=1 Tax=Aliagarivorans taiwanensis TaxID=561966 RepID=UPI00041C2448|nr:hypothetical protein [Aliagarivorans taiwanensis]